MALDILGKLSSEINKWVSCRETEFVKEAREKKASNLELRKKGCALLRATGMHVDESLNFSLNKAFSLLKSLL